VDFDKINDFSDVERSPFKIPWGAFSSLQPMFVGRFPILLPDMKDAGRGTSSAKGIS